jgi:hypothetical protein
LLLARAAFVAFLQELNATPKPSLGEMNTFFVTFRDLILRRAVPRTGMINESGFDGACYDDKGVF